MRKKKRNKKTPQQLAKEELASFKSRETIKLEKNNTIQGIHRFANQNKIYFKDLKIGFKENSIFLSYKGIQSKIYTIKGSSLKFNNKYSYKKMGLVSNIDLNIIKINNELMIGDNKKTINILNYIVSVLIAEDKFQFRNQDYILDLKPITKNDGKEYISFFIDERDNYKKKCLDFLCEQSDFIGLLPEIILTDKYELKKAEPSFLFMKEKTKNCFFIWESILSNKATYIFNFSRKKSVENNSLELLANFIGSIKFKNKRYYLTNSSGLQEKLKLQSKIIHPSKIALTEQLDNFQKWQGCVISNLNKNTIS